MAHYVSWRLLALLLAVLSPAPLYAAQIRTACNADDGNLAKDTPDVKFDNTHFDGSDPAAARAVENRKIPDALVGILEPSADPYAAAPQLADALKSSFGDITTSSGTYTASSFGSLPILRGVQAFILVKPRPNFKIE